MKIDRLESFILGAVSCLATAVLWAYISIAIDNTQTGEYARGKSVELGCAEYNSDTGVFEWKKITK